MLATALLARIHINRIFLCSRKRTENDTVHESESRRCESGTGDQKLLWKLMQPCTFDGVLISLGRLCYTLNWFTFQSMHLPRTKAPERALFPQFIRVLASARRTLVSFIAKSLLARSCRRASYFFFFFPPLFGDKNCNTVVRLVPSIWKWLKHQVIRLISVILEFKHFKVMSRLKIDVWK